MTMQTRNIQPGHWYQTKDGIGKCLQVGNNKAKFDIDRRTIWLTAKEVQYELPKGAEPKADAPAQPTPSDDFENARASLEKRIMDAVAAVDAAWQVADGTQRDLLLDVGQALQGAGKKVARLKGEQ